MDARLEIAGMTELHGALCVGPRQAEIDERWRHDVTDWSRA